MMWKCLGKCCHPIPQRFVVATMVVLALSIQYVDRLSFNLAITEITFTNAEEDVTFEGSCPFNESGGTSDHNLKAEFHWTSSEQANLLGSFYFGYIFTQIPGGVLSDWYGPKLVLGLSTFISGVCVLLTPMCARVEGTTWVMLINRVIMGLVQGPLFPAISSFVARWSAPKERDMMSSYMNMGINVGAISSNLGTGFLLHNLKSWDTVFYIYGIITILFSVFWYLFAHDSPKKHPFITGEERDKINEGIEAEKIEGRTKLPLAAILKSVPVWAMIMANVGHDWKFYIVITLLPQYISYVLHMDILSNGLINCGPYITMFIFSIISGQLAGVVVKRGWLSQTNQCKIWAVICNIIPCVFFLIGSLGGCNHAIAVVSFIMAFSFVGFAYASIRNVNVHLAPNYAGLLMSIVNAIGCFCGMLGPPVFAVFTNQQSVQGWRLGFITSFGVVGLATLAFIIFGSTDIQPWNDYANRISQEPPPPEEPTNKSA